MGPGNKGKDLALAGKAEVMNVVREANKASPFRPIAACSLLAEGTTYICWKSLASNSAASFRVTKLM